MVAFVLVGLRRHLAMLEVVVFVHLTQNLIATRGARHGGHTTRLQDAISDMNEWIF